MDSRFQTLVLSNKEVVDIANDELVRGAVEEAFGLAGRGMAQMPAKSYLMFTEHSGDLRTMPAYLPSLKAAGVKVVNSHPKNSGIGFPTVMAVIVLNDPASGFPICILAASALTALRTGAAGALAAKHLARPDARSAGFIGAGMQARHQYRFLRLVRDLETVRVYDIDGARAGRFCDDIRPDGVEASST